AFFAVAFTLFFLGAGLVLAAVLVLERVAAGLAVLVGGFCFVFFSAAILRDSLEEGNKREGAPPNWGR
ncbi:MAG: hypothetical protein CMO47_11720, partial [Verrucomicrobiales bacterium]|nr:hypothetical protein [Verrucomicrobiales bacterium]